jgi:hypothetical protein
MQPRKVIKTYGKNTRSIRHMLPTEDSHIPFVPRNEPRLIDEIFKEDFNIKRPRKPRAKKVVAKPSPKPSPKPTRRTMRNTASAETLNDSNKEQDQQDTESDSGEQSEKIAVKPMQPSTSQQARKARPELNPTDQDDEIFSPNFTAGFIDASTPVMPTRASKRQRVNRVVTKQKQVGLPLTITPLVGRLPPTTPILADVNNEVNTDDFDDQPGDQTFEVESVNPLVPDNNPAAQKSAEEDIRGNVGSLMDFSNGGSDQPTPGSEVSSSLDFFREAGVEVDEQVEERGTADVKEDSQEQEFDMFEPATPVIHRPQEVASPTPKVQPVNNDAKEKDADFMSPFTEFMQMPTTPVLKATRIKRVNKMKASNNSPKETDVFSCSQESLASTIVLPMSRSSSQVEEEPIVVSQPPPQPRQYISSFHKTIHRTYGQSQTTAAPMARHIPAMTGIPADLLADTTEDQIDEGLESSDDDVNSTNPAKTEKHA